MMILVLTLMIAGVAISSPVNYSKKTFEYSLMQIILESMNSSNNHYYRSGTLLGVNNIPSEEGYLSTLEISVLLEINCIAKSLCPREICTMLIKQDKTNNLFVDGQSKKCHYDKSKSTLNHLDHRSKRATSEVDVNDPKIQDFVKRGKNLVTEFQKTSQMSVTTTLNATKEETAGGVKYLIYFRMVDPICMTVESSSICSINNDSPVRVCTVVVDEQRKSSITITDVNATCEKKQNALG